MTKLTFKLVEGGGFDEFKQIIEDFVEENFYVDGLCNSCSDNIPDILPKVFGEKDKEKYEENLKKLFDDLK